MTREAIEEARVDFIESKMLGTMKLLDCRHAKMHLLQARAELNSGLYFQCPFARHAQIEIIQLRFFSYLILPTPSLSERSQLMHWTSSSRGASCFRQSNKICKVIMPRGHFSPNAISTSVRINLCVAQRAMVQVCSRVLQCEKVFVVSARNNGYVNVDLVCCGNHGFPYSSWASHICGWNSVLKK